MRRALLLALALCATVLAASPALATAETISLGGGLGITYDNGPVLSITTLPSGEAQLLLANGTSNTCAGAILALSSIGHPSCVADSVVLPSTQQQIDSGVAQLTSISVWFNAQALGYAGAADQVIIINPYTGAGYRVETLTCSTQWACGQSATMTLYNAGLLPAPVLSNTGYSVPGQLLPAVQAGASSLQDGTLSGGF